MEQQINPQRTGVSKTNVFIHLHFRQFIFSLRGPLHTFQPNSQITSSHHILACCLKVKSTDLHLTAVCHMLKRMLRFCRLQAQHMYFFFNTEIVNLALGFYDIKLQDAAV